MKELFKFLQTFVSDWSYDAEEAMEAAKEDGLVEDFELVDVQEIERKRWGRLTQFTFDLLNDTYVAVVVYVMNSDDVDDLFEDVYMVEPYEISLIRYRRIENGN